MHEREVLHQRKKQELLTLAKESRTLDPYCWWYQVWTLLVTPLPLGQSWSSTNSEYILANQTGVNPAIK